MPTSDQLSKIPERFPPQLALNVTQPPKGSWLWEIKFDGYRAMLRILDGKVTLYTKNGADWTRRFPRIVSAVESLGLQNAWLDGEVVLPSTEGTPDFGGLQAAIAEGETDDVVLYLFDLMFYARIDYRTRPIEQRRRKLEGLLEDVDLPNIRFSEAFAEPVESLLASACAMGLEGVIGKKAGSSYTSTRNGDWVKLKCKQRQEFVIAGYTSAQAGAGIGSLVLARYDDSGNLLYAGRVSSGIRARDSAILARMLMPLKSDCPLSSADAKLKASAIWVKPELVCEVQYAELTRRGLIRHGVFVALRSDTPAKFVKLE